MMSNSASVFTASIFMFICLAFAKECKKLDACRCEMSDGSGIVDMWKLDNSDGTPRFTDIPTAGAIGSPYKFSFNPCTKINTCQSNICRKQQDQDDLSCGLPDPTFTVDVDGNAVINFKEIDQRSTQIVLVCDNSIPGGEFGDGISYTSSGTSTIYTGKLTARYACAFPSSLSVGSILLIIFFPCVLMYVVVGIIINVKLRHKTSIPEVFPNHSFWADFPFLVKDGCVFSFKSLMKCFSRGEKSSERTTVSSGYSGKAGYSSI